jgi:hypothetical protein
MLLQHLYVRGEHRDEQDDQPECSETAELGQEESYPTGNLQYTTDCDQRCRRGQIARDNKPVVCREDEVQCPRRYKDYTQHSSRTVDPAHLCDQ